MRLRGEVSLLCLYSTTIGRIVYSVIGGVKIVVIGSSDVMGMVLHFSWIILTDWANRSLRLPRHCHTSQ